MNVHQRDVFTTMRADLDRVESVLLSAARMRYPMISRLLEGIVGGGGKRLRPVVLLLAARAFDQFDDNAIDVAAGVELLHTASLVHDDSIDKAALRRGNPTLNTELSTGAVILIGDYLFAQSAILAASPGNPRVMVIFAQTLADICEGQIRETLEAHHLDQSMADYEARIYGKTAALFAGAAEMGAELGQGSPEQVQNMRQFGIDLGMAFQIIDDVLDLRESSETIGKPAGNDLRQGVVTVPIMKFAEAIGRDDPDYGRMESVIAGDDIDQNEMDALLNRVRASGALDAAFDVAQGYIDAATARLSDVPNGSVRESLAEVLDLTIRRRT